MKKLVALVFAIVASNSFAVSQSDLNKIQTLANAWKTQAVKHQQLKNDLNIVYGGSDINRPYLQTQPTAV